MTLLAAILAKYDSLAAGNFADDSRPPAYHDQAPQVASGQLRPPYVVVTLEADETDLTFEAEQDERHRLTFAVLTAGDTPAADADEDVAAIRFNGGTVQAAQGFDSGTLPGLTDGTLLSVLPVGPPTRRLEGVDKNGQNVYRTEMRYAVSVERN